jgi:prepilin-type processing-associated H-X9-DG protein
MTITRRIIKGTALTYQEMDENLRDLRFDTDLTRILENGNTTSLNATFNSTVTTSTLTTTALNISGKTAEEYIEDVVGTMFTSASHSGGVTVSYADGSGTISISVDHPESANGGGGGGDTTIINQGATTLSDLTDVSLGTLQTGQVLKYNGSAWVNGTDNSSGTGSSSFLGLSDTPINFGSAGQALVVNSSGNGLVFETISGGSSSGDATFTSVTTESLTITGTGTTVIESGTDIELDATNRVRVIDTPFRLANMTTSQRNAFSAANGDMIYNTSTNKAQVYANGSWVNLH